MVQGRKFSRIFIRLHEATSKTPWHGRPAQFEEATWMKNTDIKGPNRGTKQLVFRLMLGACLAALPGASTALAKGGATFASIFSFAPYGPTGDQGAGLLVQDRGKTMYGETGDSIYAIAPDGKEKVVADLGLGADCSSGMTLGADGLLYGTCAIWENNESSSGSFSSSIRRKSPSMSSTRFLSITPQTPNGRVH
jgi:hypothetical protein